MNATEVVAKAVAPPVVFRLLVLQVSMDATGGTYTCTVGIKQGDKDLQTDAAPSRNSVVAICKAIGRVTGFDGKLLRYHANSVGECLDEFEALVVVAGKDGGQVSAQARSVDILVALGTAYLAAINKICSGECYIG